MPLSTLLKRLFLLILVVAAMAALVWWVERQLSPSPNTPPPVSGSRAPVDTASKISWNDLVPADWSIDKALGDLNIAPIQDNDPRVEQIFKKIEEMRKTAPTVPAMEGRTGYLEGFAVPLDVQEGGLVTEFLVVPYFGACIHMPPPPANQIIHAVSDQPLHGVEAMAQIRVYGTLGLERHSSEWGDTGYRMKVTKIDMM